MEFVKSLLISFPLDGLLALNPSVSCFNGKGCKNRLHQLDQQCKMSIEVIMQTDQ